MATNNQVFPCTIHPNCSINDAGYHMNQVSPLQPPNPTPPRQSKLDEILEAYKAAVIHEYRFPDDVGTRLSTLAAKNFDQYMLDSFLELIGPDEPSLINADSSPHPETKQTEYHDPMIRNKLKAELRLAGRKYYGVDT